MLESRRVMALFRLFPGLEFHDNRRSDQDQGADDEDGSSIVHGAFITIE